MQPSSWTDPEECRQLNPLHLKKLMNNIPPPCELIQRLVTPCSCPTVQYGYAHGEAKAVLLDIPEPQS